MCRLASAKPDKLLRSLHHHRNACYGIVVIKIVLSHVKKSEATFLIKKVLLHHWDVESGEALVEVQNNWTNCNKSFVALHSSTSTFSTLIRIPFEGCLLIYDSKGKSVFAVTSQRFGFAHSFAYETTRVRWKIEKNYGNYQSHFLASHSSFSYRYCKQQRYTISITTFAPSHFSHLLLSSYHHCRTHTAESSWSMLWNCIIKRLASKRYRIKFLIPNSTQFIWQKATFWLPLFLPILLCVCANSYPEVLGAPCANKMVNIP